MAIAATQVATTAERADDQQHVGARFLSPRRRTSWPSVIQARLQSRRALCAGNHRPRPSRAGSSVRRMKSRDATRAGVSSQKRQRAAEAAPAEHGQNDEEAGRETQTRSLTITWRRTNASGVEQTLYCADGPSPSRSAAGNGSILLDASTRGDRAGRDRRGHSARWISHAWTSQRLIYVEGAAPGPPGRSSLLELPRRDWGRPAIILGRAWACSTAPRVGAHRPAAARRRGMAPGCPRPGIRIRLGIPSAARSGLASAAPGRDSTRIPRLGTAATWRPGT